MKRSERLSSNAFRRLMWAIVTVGTAANALIWAVALTLSRHDLFGVLLGAVTMGLAAWAFYLLKDAARLWRLASEEEAYEWRASIRPKLSFNSTNTARGAGRN